jgi:TrmH family RNA methyltransferase
LKQQCWAKSQAKYIQSLGQKKVRDEQGVFVAEGPKIVAELLASANADIQQLYALPDWIKANLHDCNGVELQESR